MARLLPGTTRGATTPLFWRTYIGGGDGDAIRTNLELLAHNAGRQGGRWVSSGATKGAISEPLPRLNETFIETIPQSRPGRDKMPRRWQQLPNVSGGEES